jgi:hypothetical protein
MVPEIRWPWFAAAGMNRDGVWKGGGLRHGDRSTSIYVGMGEFGDAWIHGFGSDLNRQRKKKMRSRKAQAGGERWVDVHQTRIKYA